MERGLVSGEGYAAMQRYETMRYGTNANMNMNVGTSNGIRKLIRVVREERVLGGGDSALGLTRASSDRQDASMTPNS
jgi:hypothetical protein